MRDFLNSDTKAVSERTSNLAFGEDFETDTGNSGSMRITITAFTSAKLLKGSLYVR